MHLFIKKICLLVALSGCSIFSFAQSVKTIKLKATEKITLHSYNIQNVVDDREDTSNIGTMHTGLSNKLTAIDLANGAQHAITDFIQQHIASQDTDNAVELHIAALSITESRERGMQERADLDAKFAFYINGEKLIEYSGSSFAQAGLNASPYVGKLVSESIQNVLKQFDSWFGENESKYKDSKKFMVNVVLKTTSDDSDYIVYTKSTQLQLGDFAGKPDNMSLGAAATYSGMLLSYEINNKTGPTIATVEVTPYMDKTRSWVKSKHKSAYILSHEQLHFEITAYITCHFIDALKKADLSPDNFKQKITSLQQEYAQLIQDTQDQYDDETQHGTIPAKQEAWKRKVESELATANCY